MNGRLDSGSGTVGDPGSPPVRSVVEVAAAAVRQMPPECRFTTADARTIHQHQDVLLRLEPQVVQAFYDTLYRHPPTAAVFRDGERPAREATLSDWWRRTAAGPLDDEYFSWMALVGLVHVARGVEDPAMLAMAEHIVDIVAQQLAVAGLPAGEVDQLIMAIRRLASTVGAVITFGYTYGYDEAVGAALYDIAGMPEALVHRLRDRQIAAAVSRGRQDIGRAAEPRDG